MEVEHTQIITDENDPSVEGSDSDDCSFDSSTSIDESNENCKDLARLSLEQICESIDEEERLLNDLENRRKKLEADMERLEEEIEIEKQYYRKAIDEEIAKKKESLSTEDNSSGGIHKKPEIFNMDEFQSKFQEIRNVLQESTEQMPNKCEDDGELERFKLNLASYRKTIDETNKDTINKHKKRAASKLFQKHLEEVEVKCDEQMDNLATIQKSIEVSNLFK